MPELSASEASWERRALTSDLERTRSQAWVAAMNRLNEAQPTLRIDEAVYAEVFNQMPTPVWIEDWSGVPPALAERGSRGRATWSMNCNKNCRC